MTMRALLFLIGALSLAGGIRGDELPGIGVMRWGDTDRIGRPFAKDPSVIKFQGRYLMYYSICAYAKERLPPDSKIKGWAIGIAESRNLTDWKKAGEILPQQECEQNGIVNGRVIKLGDKLHLFYNSYGNAVKDAICHATSTDGLKWERDASNPIIRTRGDWNSGRAIDCDVLEHDGRLLLYFATRDPSMKTQMLVVASADLKSDFSRDTWTQIGDGPVLNPELPWETKCIEAPSLIKRDGTIYLFYGGGYNNDPQQIGCASSKDGLHFTRLFVDQPMIPNGKPGEWNSSETGHPGIFLDDDGQTYLFVQGNPDHGKSWYLSWVKIGWADGKPLVIR